MTETNQDSGKWIIPPVSRCRWCCKALNRYRWLNGFLICEDCLHKELDCV